MAIKFGPATQGGIIDGLLAILERKQAILDMERELRKNHGITFGQDGIPYDKSGNPIDIGLPGTAAEPAPGAPRDLFGEGGLGLDPGQPGAWREAQKSPYSLPDMGELDVGTQRSALDQYSGPQATLDEPDWHLQGLSYDPGSRASQGQGLSMPAGYTPPTYGGGDAQDRYRPQPASLGLATGTIGAAGQQSPYALSLNPAPERDPYGLSLGMPGKEMSAYDRYRLKMGGLRSR